MIRNKGIFKQYSFFILFLAFSISITFSQTNTPPIAINNYATADQDTTLSVPSGAPDNYTNLLDNASDVDGDTLLITRFSIDGGITWTNVGDTINIAGIGSITINADGTYTFVPVFGYSGDGVPDIMYEISDGTDTTTAILFLTVETNDKIIKISSITSCNQGYTANGNYKIKYKIVVENLSKTRGYHVNSEVTGIQLKNDLESIFGDTCITEIQREEIGVNKVNDFHNSVYPMDYSILAWDNIEFNESDVTPGAQGMFNAGTVGTAKLYPRQKLTINYCVIVNPDCNGRPYPAPVGSGIDFDNVVNLTSTHWNDTAHLTITDFHTTETTVSANLFLPDLEDLGNEVFVFDPIVQPDATFEYNQRVIITNNGTSTAENVNFNLGLKKFTIKGVVFKPFDNTAGNGGITQIGATTVNINNNFDGIGNTLLLEPNNSLAAGETIILQIHYIVTPMPEVDTIMYFSQLNTSMTQGTLDGQGAPPVFIDEFIDKENYSYVFWKDGMGNHLDRYYKADTDTSTPSSNEQCKCNLIGMRLFYNLSAHLNKSSTVIDESPNGIDEFQEVTFEFTFTNTTPALQLENIQIKDDLTSICGGNVVSVSTPEVLTESTATQYPNVNVGFNGDTDKNVFDGQSGIILAEVEGGAAAEFIKVRFNVVFVDDCKGENELSFIATDHSGNNEITGSNTSIDIDGNAIPPASVNLFSDTDNDGITNINDIDDDNDGILDIVECNGLDPLGNGLIPNYRNTTATNDINGDGIVDIFDFDLDGIPNHFDLDSDNDGITDIIEAGGIDTDNNGLVPVNADGTLVLDSDNDGLTDDVLVDTNNDGVADIPVDVDVAGGVLIPNLDSDGDTHVNALDIDSDNDGIVDNIEAQVSNMNTQVSSDIYLAPNTPDLLGLVYTDGLIPIDTDGDIIPDYLDTDSDDDTRFDIVEGWDTNNDGIANTLPLNTDADNDGLDDAFDLNSLIVNSLANSTNTQIPTNFPNVDNPFTIERDWREIPAIVVIISNESETEGNDLNFTISLVSLGSYIDNSLDVNNPLVPKASVFPIKIELFTGENTAASQYEKAKATFDYTPIIQSNTEIAIPVGDTSYTFTENNSVNVIQTIDDTIDELDETFILNGLVITENTVNPATNEIEINVPCKGVGTIIDNDAAPDLIMNDDTKDEGEPLIHIVQIDNSINPTTASSRPIDIEIEVTDQTAIHPEDYTNTSPDTVTIPATEDPNNPNTSITYSITTILDSVNEPDDETISVVGTVIAGSVGTTDLNKIGTIIDKQPPPKVIISSPTIVEGDVLEFIISLVHPATNVPLAHYEDIIVRVFTSNGTAREPDDYLPIGLDIPMDITIPATVFNTKIQVITNDDKLVEDVEDLTLIGKVLSLNADNIDAEGIGTIIDNDLPNLFSPNDDGFSDVFEVVHLLQYLNFKLQIFDRWGSEVYNYSNNGNPSPEWWDGTIKGNPVPEGVYYYTVDYNDGKTKPISGFIQLIR